MTHGGCRGWRKARAWAAATALAAGTAFPTQGAPLTDWGAIVASAWSRHPQSAGWPERGRESAAAREAASAGAPEPASVTLGVRDDRVGSGRGRQEWEVEFAVPLCFLALLAPLFRDLPSVLAAATAGIAVLALSHLPMKLSLIVAGLIGIGIGTVADLARERWTTR